MTGPAVVVDALDLMDMRVLRWIAECPDQSATSIQRGLSGTSRVNRSLARLDRAGAIIRRRYASGRTENRITPVGERILAAADTSAAGIHHDQPGGTP